jgi:hypothetical protein
MFRTTNQDVWIIAIGLGILDRNCDVDSDDGPSKRRKRSETGLLPTSDIRLAGEMARSRGNTWQNDPFSPCNLTTMAWSMVFVRLCRIQNTLC